MNPVIETIFEAFRRRGSGKYGSEAVTQLQHALQCGQLARQAGSEDQLVAAALLHDIGHILSREALPASCGENLDDDHERIGYEFLKQSFGPAVADPVRLHVAAKRYLCTREPEYEASLSPTSRKSYHDQGGPMSGEELRQFESEPFYRQALQLRRWDDTGKDPAVTMPELEAFRGHLESCLR